MSVVPKGQFDYVSARLEDLENSLAAAVARIEILRLREKQLLAELATKLQQDLHQGLVKADTGTQTEQTAEAAPEHKTADEPAAIPLSNTSRYITEVDGHLPVMLVSPAGRKTPGSIVITPEYVDFVEVRARIRRHDFVGFTAAPPATAAAARAAGNQCMPCLPLESSSPTAAGLLNSTDGDQVRNGAPAAGPAPAEGGSSSSSSSWVPADRQSAGSTLIPQGGRAAGTCQSAIANIDNSSSSSSSWHHNSPGSTAAWMAVVDSTNKLPSAGAAVGVSATLADGGRRGMTGNANSSSSSSSSRSTGMWQILFQGGGRQQRLTFEATHETRELLHRHTSRWLGEGSGSGEGSSSVLSQVALGAAATAAMASDAVELAVPRHLVPGVGVPTLSEPSAILASSSPSSRSPADASADDSADAGGASLVQGLQHLAAALPPRFQSRPWFLLYSTARHGISLTTLYRRAAGRNPSVLLVRDVAGYVFGAYCTEPWRPAPRFFGTGESFVFQLEPHKLMYPWKVRSALKNDFFQYAQPESLAVGGLGAFAIWLDAELLHGSSGSCGTFGSPSLASREEFKVATVELWGLDS